MPANPRYRPGDRIGSATVVDVTDRRAAANSVVYRVRCDRGHVTDRDSNVLAKARRTGTNPPCEECRRQPLPDARASAIVADRRAGMRIDQIGKRHGVTKQRVSQIVAETVEAAEREILLAKAADLIPAVLAQSPEVVSAIAETLRKRARAQKRSRRV